MIATECFPPTRTAALERLQAFVPHAGRTYAARRNYDAGAGCHKGVSTLSPYIRCRLITEEEVLGAVLGRHTPQAAEKFVQEVFWRTYWKGWLELRPEIWTRYTRTLQRDWDAVQTQSGLRDRWAAACQGETEIACFNAWAKELCDTGYLHNHARMWFASIWIFTLQLPWTLGADFFLRHLLDGDPASNTLSWRWVAGLQTRGKTYLARPDNIAKYTEGRFAPPAGQLATSAPPLDDQPAPPPRALPPAAKIAPDARTGLLLHEEDLSPAFLLDQTAPVAAGILGGDRPIGPLKPAPHVAAFREAARNDAVSRWATRWDRETPTLDTPEAIAAWAAEQELDQIVTAYAPVGPVADRLDALERQPGLPPLLRLLRPYDAAAWPQATKGFFPFKAKIPTLLQALGL